MADCIFCDIVEGGIDSTIIYEDDGFGWTFKEIIPIDIKELGKELSAEVFRLIDNKH